MSKKIVVIGDTILDKYIYIEPTKISDEAHVITSIINNEKYSLGGASNVARNVATLGNECYYIGTSSNEYNSEITSLLNSYNIKYHLFNKKGAIQVKTRIMSSRGHQTCRFDTFFENIEYDDKNTWNQISSFLSKIKKIDTIIISKYYDNFLNPKLIEKIIDYANKNKIVIIADNRQNNIQNFQKVDFYKMNFNEFKNAFNVHSIKNTFQNITETIKKSKTNIKNIIITRSELPTILIRCENNKYTFSEIMVDKVKVNDVSGAGDTFVASLATFYNSKDKINKIINKCHTACRIVVSKLGTEVVWKDEIDNDVNYDNISSLVNRLKNENKKIVFTNGVFDILHTGHIELLKQSKNEGDHLIVGINSDQSVKKIKGNDRPIKNEDERKLVLQSIKYVDSVIIFNDLTVDKLLKLIKPNVYVKGADYNVKNIPERDSLKYVQKVVFVDYVSGKSSSNLTKKLRKVS